ncbi:hypothetical protein [Olivibacter jilunii]
MRQQFYPFPELLFNFGGMVNEIYLVVLLSIPEEIDPHNPLVNRELKFV